VAGDHPLIVAPRLAMSSARFSVPVVSGHHRADGAIPNHGHLAGASRPTPALWLRCDVGGSWRCFGASRNTNWT